MMTSDLDCFAYQKFMLKIFGISEYQNLFYKMCAIILYIILAVYPFLVLPEMIEKTNNFDDVVYGSFFEITYFITICNNIYFYFNKFKLIAIFRKLNSPIFQRDNEMYNGEKCFIDKIRSLIHIQSYFGMLATSSMLVLFLSVGITMSIIENELKEPFGYGPYIDNKMIQFLYHTLAYCLGLWIINLYIWFYLNTLTFIIGHFKNLQKCISSIIERSNLNFMQQSKSNADIVVKKNKHEVAVPWKFLNDEIKEIVRYHNAILELSNEVENLFNVLNFILFGGLMICLCLLAYQSSLLTYRNINLLRNLEATLYGFFVLFLLSYFGEKLLTQSEKISNECYNIAFSFTDIRFQKCLLIIMRRSQEPSIQTIGKFQIMCLNTYLLVCKSIYTYYTVLQNLNQ